MTKQECIKIYKNTTMDIKKFKIEGLKIHDGKKRIGFTPQCKITENKPRHIFWRGRKSLILFVDGALNALRFNEPTEKMQLAWDKKEARNFVYKMVALASVEMKPLKMWQFAAIILLLIAVLIIALRTMMIAGLPI